MDKWNLTCMMCDKKETFQDIKDITFTKWKIIAWKVDKNEPYVVCPKCEYKSMNSK